MTSNLNKYPSRVNVNYDNKKGMIAIDQIRTIDKKRIVKYLDKLSKTEIKATKAVIKEAFVD